MGSSPLEPPPPHGRYRYVQYPLDAPINTMTDDEYNAYRQWQGFWPGVPPGWPNWPPEPAAVAAERPADYGQVNRATISCPPGWVPPPDYPPEMLPLDWVPPVATVGNDSGAGI